MLSYNEKREWVKTLKEGDEVAVDVGRFGSRSYVITKVKKITPKGKVRVEYSDMLFDGDGYYRESGSWGNSYYMYPVTEEIVNTITRSRHLKFLDTFKFDTLTDDQLKAVIEIIK